MIRRSARETKPPMNFGTPFYRMKLTEKWRSAQHEMLLELDAGPNEVFYAAPLFHKVEELNRAYLEGTVSDQSCYVRPGKIGKLDGDPHHVAFDTKKFRVCSDPCLQRLADISLQCFGAQLFVVQRREAEGSP